MIITVEGNDNSEITYDFRQIVVYTSGLGLSHIEKILLRIEHARLRENRGEERVF